jgi:signal transduction histidine kinase/CheY-like chemotaxis protein
MNDAQSGIRSPAPFIVAAQSHDDGSRQQTAVVEPEERGPHAERSLEDITTLESMRMRIEQTTLTALVIFFSAFAMSVSMRGRVDPVGFNIWMGFMVGATAGRAVLCKVLQRRIETATSYNLRRYERYLFASAIVNAIAIGSSYWLVARTGDLTVQMVITFISCFYGIGTLVNASSHFPSFAVVSAINLGQGVLFWLGLGPGDTPHLEIAIPFLAVSLLIVGFGYKNGVQIRESLSIRTQNLALLQRLALDKKIVEQALEEARKASESKSRFLAAASHDLRQPLHALTLFLGTLSFHVSTEDAKRLLRRIKDTTLVLQDQFNSLLDLSKFDVGAVQPDIAPFRLDLLVHHIVSELQPEANAKNLILTASVGVTFAKSDRLLIARVLRNLVVNAVTYTVAGSIVVSVETVDGSHAIDVIDTGPGIPDDEQSKVFEEYVQLANPARQRRHGMGLGLSIVKRIDALLGLRLTLKSSVGIGSRFRFHVPACEGAEIALPSVADFLDSTRIAIAAVIWILDDDPDVVDALQEQLLSWGAVVKAFSQPNELLHALRSGVDLPHWILTDDMLGSALSGLETAQILASEFDFCKVCLITGNTEPHRLAELRASGFPVIVKPAQPESLIAVLRDSVTVLN